jgi:S-formylglutathione hydrolase FrmB
MAAVVGRGAKFQVLAALLSVAALAGCTAVPSGGPAQLHPPGPPGPATASSPARLIDGSGQWKSVSTPVSGDPATASRQIVEYVPPVADPRALPVVYLLHGLPGSAAELCTPTLGEVLLAAFRAGAAPFLLACPDGNPATETDPEWADAAGGGSRLESFVTTAAITVVEGSALRNSGSRAIAGFSMGGFAAASIALRHPDRYGQVVSLAGYFHLDDPDHVFGNDASSQAAHDPTALLRIAGRLRWYLGRRPTTPRNSPLMTPSVIRPCCTAPARPSRWR